MPTAQEIEDLKAALLPKKVEAYSLRFTEKHSKQKEDYMRISFQKEDEAFLEE